MIEKSYKCETCGKIVKTKDKKIPMCCEHPMKMIPVDICLQPSHPEHFRPMDHEEPCDQGNQG